MAMTLFRSLFPQLADDECRSIIVRNRDGVPDDDYALLELFCIDAACDCRRTILSVFARRKNKVVATIGIGFDRDEEDAGPYLDPLNPQSKHAEELLEFVEESALADPDYVARLERHYHLVKAAVNDPEHPAQKRLPPLVEQQRSDAKNVLAFAQLAAKVGRNEACPCGSGKKFKRCCLSAPQGREWKRGSLSRA